MSFEMHAEFEDLIKEIRSRRDMISLTSETKKAFICAIHSWLMENTQDKISKTFSGVMDCTSFGAAAHSREPYSFRRYINFIQGAIVFDQHLYEFVPGGVYVYALPGVHLMTLKFPNEHPALPEALHVHYGPTRGEATVFRQYIDHGWLLMEGSGNTYHSLPNPDGEIAAHNVLSVINGGALRMIYSAFHRAIRSARGLHKDTTDPNVKLWAGTKQEWFSAIKRVAKTTADVTYLREHRDRMKAFDPTRQELIDLYWKVNTLDGHGWTPQEVYDRGTAMIDIALCNILSAPR